MGKKNMKKEKVLVLRTCESDMTSYNGFKWPESGPIECGDWSPEPKCGNGLHGLLWGCGDGSLLDWSEGAKWLVVEVDAAAVVDLEGKVKFPSGAVVYCGDLDGAVARIKESLPAGFQGLIVGDKATAGNYGQATAGNYGRATAGDYGQATAGDNGRATAGDYGQATTGHRGQATTGHRGQATAGDGGQATAGNYGQATAGNGGELNIRWWDGKRYRTAVLYVGEDGIEAGVAYRVDSEGKPVKVEK